MLGLLIVVRDVILAVLLSWVGLSSDDADRQSDKPEAPAQALSSPF